MGRQQKFTGGACNGTHKRSKRIGSRRVTHDSQGTALEYPYTCPSYETSQVAYTGKYEVFLDLDSIQVLVARAAWNKNRRCKSGPVTVKAQTSEMVMAITADPVTTLEMLSVGWRKSEAKQQEEAK